MTWQPLNLTAICPAHSEITACTAFGIVYLNLLAHLFQGSYDERKQKRLGHLGREESEIVEEYDFIIVGAGSAGCLLANRLSEVEEWKILLLEAGPEQPDVTLPPGTMSALLGSSIDWGFTSEPNGKSCLAAKRCGWSKGKVMGGTTSLNTMTYIRGNKVDYDKWADMGNEGWSYDEVLPYFKKSEQNLNIEGLNRKYHSVSGEQGVSRFPYIDDPALMLNEAYIEKGLPLTDFNGKHQGGTMQAQAFAKDGERDSANNAFIQPIRYKRKNLVVKPNSDVFKILIEKNVAYGVKYIRNGKVYTAVAKKEVIVSGGPVNTPKLLMLSGIGPKEDLEKLNIEVVKDLDVGKNLQDHPTYNGIIISLPNETATVVSKKEVLDHIIRYSRMKIKEGPISANAPQNTATFYKTDDSLDVPNIQIQCNGVIGKEMLSDPILYGSVSIFPTAFYDSLVPRIQYLEPKSRGEVKLNASDPYGPPLIFANYFDDPNDIEYLIMATKFVLTLEDTESFKARGATFVRTPMPACRHLRWGSDIYIQCLIRQYTTSSYHSVGTCKMGPKSDSSAVVDPRLRVFGVARLRVIDSSVIPVIPHGNTNAPTMMVAEKGADMVKEDWLGKDFQYYGKYV